MEEKFRPLVEILQELDAQIYVVKIENAKFINKTLKFGLLLTFFFNPSEAILV